MSRKFLPFIVALVLVCLVMAVSGVFAFSGAVTAENSEAMWSQPYSTAESMNVINVLGDDQDELGMDKWEYCGQVLLS